MTATVLISPDAAVGRVASAIFEAALGEQRAAREAGGDGRDEGGHQKRTAASEKLVHG